MRKFKGRPIIEGKTEGQAVVTRAGFNTLASFQKSVLAKKKTVICSDQNNKYIYGKEITGKILCLPKTIGSTTGGMILQTAATMNLAPMAMLFSEEIDSLALAGVILAKVWNGIPIITIDKLGADFLEYVKDRMTIEINENGTVVVK